MLIGRTTFTPSALVLFTILISACNQRKSEHEINFKIPNPLREGIKDGKITFARVDLYLGENILKNIRDTNYLVEYDSNGNMIREGKQRYLFDENGFKKVEFHDGGDFSYKNFIFYKPTSTYRLNSIVYDLKNQDWNAKIDTTEIHRVFQGPNFFFNSKGYLIKETDEIRVNKSYFYDSFNKLITIIDSFSKEVDPYDSPIRKEYIYDQKGKLISINSFSRTNLISKLKLNDKNLVDSVFSYDENGKIHLISVYKY